MAKSIITPAFCSRSDSRQLPPRQRWDQRYATLPSGARSKPTPFVTACLEQLPGQGRALDIAAGTGRHAIALAQHGWQVDAVDISWQGLRLAQQRAVEAGLTPGEQVRFMVADVERPWLPHRQYEVILVSFFLCRPLFALIKDRLVPGGWLIYESFTVEQGKYFDIRPTFLLKPGELKEAFSDFEILFYEEDWHHEKASAQLLARKPGSSFDT